MTGTITFKRKLDDAGDWIDLPVYTIFGKEVTEEEFRAIFPEHDIGSFAVPSTSAWPMASEAMAVHPKQIDVARRLDAERGAPPTDYNSMGQPIWHSERHKREYNKAHGVHDRNSFS